MSALFVNDGYTINATIEFANGKVEVLFRPPVGDELEQVYVGRVDPSDFLASKIVNWRGMGLDGVPVKAENIKRLHAQFWQTLMKTVVNFQTENEIKNS